MVFYWGFFPNFIRHLLGLFVCVWHWSITYMLYVGDCVTWRLPCQVNPWLTPNKKKVSNVVALETTTLWCSVTSLNSMHISVRHAVVKVPLVHFLVVWTQVGLFICKNFSPFIPWCVLGSNLWGVAPCSVHLFAAAQTRIWLLLSKMVYLMPVSWIHTFIYAVE